MMRNTDSAAYRISALGEFCDQALEQEFFRDYMDKNVKYICPISLIFGILNMLFIVPDYFFLADRRAFFTTLVIRAVFLLCCVLFFFAVQRFRNYGHLALWITGFEILGSISFLFIFGQYGRPNFLIQAFGVIVIISAIFVAPNKWINMLAAAAFACAAFFLIARCSAGGVPLTEYLAGMVYILIILVLSGMGAFRSNYYNRKQYAYSRELLKLSSTDGLTGICNRGKCDAELARRLAYAARYRAPLSVIFFDIDHFKSVNDVSGHLAGDRVIVDLTGLVRGMIRESDVFARWGGDEFMLLLPGVGRQQALELAERLRAAIAGCSFRDVGRVTCSFGVVAAEQGDSAACLVGRADRLLYASKLQGRNRVTG